jgi:hypothetical protein
MGHEVVEVFFRFDRRDDFDTGGGFASWAWVPLVRYVGGRERKIHWKGMGLVELRCMLRVRGMGGKYPLDVFDGRTV